MTQTVVSLRRRRLLLTALAVGTVPLLPGAATRVNAAPACDSEPDRPAARPAAPAALAADLPAPFAYRPDAGADARAVAEAVDAVRKQAEALGAEGCYVEKPARIAGRIDFLSPYEFLVVTLFDRDPERRDALLDQYRADPRAAIRALGDAYPSPRAQATIASYAYYDVSSDRIRVNAAHVPSAQVRRVLVHEMWHAMPHARTWTDEAGQRIRANGFWLQEQRAGSPIWVPLEDRRGLPYASHLLDEAMATMMETRYAGPSPYAQPDQVEAQRFLQKLMSVAGAPQVMSDYLESQPYRLSQHVEAHRASFPELEIVARP